jgi:NADH:ubiquinone oxidoreductase subunit H
MPFAFKAFLVDIDLGLFFIFAVSSLNVYGVIIAG